MIKSPNNVIQFPRQAIKYPARTGELFNDVKPDALKEVKDIYYLLKAKKSEEIVGMLLPLLTQGFAAYGINLSETKNTLNIALMVESIRSGIYGYFGIDHPLQPLANQLFQVENGRINLKNIDVHSSLGNNSSNSA